MFNLGKNIRVLPNVVPLYKKGNNLLMLEKNTLEKRNASSETSWFLNNLDVRHVDDSCEHTSLKECLKDCNMMPMQWLEHLSKSYPEGVDVYLNGNEWHEFYAYYICRLLPNATPEMRYRLYRYTMAWVNNFIAFLGEGRTDEDMQDSWPALKFVMDFDIFNRITKDLLIRHRDDVLPKNMLPIEVLLAQYMTGKQSDVLNDFMQEIYYKEIRSLLVGLDFILTFKDRKETLTQEQWNIVHDIMQDANNIKKYKREDLLELRRLNAVEFELGEESEDRFYPKGNWVDGFIKSETQEEMRFYLIGPDRYVTNVNSYVLADILKHKDDLSYLKQFL